MVVESLLDVETAVLLTENADTMSAKSLELLGDPVKNPFLANAVILRSAEEQADIVVSDTMSWGSNEDSKEAPSVVSRAWDRSWISHIETNATHILPLKIEVTCRD